MAPPPFELVEKHVAPDHKPWSWSRASTSARPTGGGMPKIPSIVSRIIGLKHQNIDSSPCLEKPHPWHICILGCEVCSIIIANFSSNHVRTAVWLQFSKLRSLCSFWIHVPSFILSGRAQLLRRRWQHPYAPRDVGFTIKPIPLHCQKPLGAFSGKTYKELRHRICWGECIMRRNWIPLWEIWNFLKQRTVILSEKIKSWTLWTSTLVPEMLPSTFPLHFLAAMPTRLSLDTCVIWSDIWRFCNSFLLQKLPFKCNLFVSWDVHIR